MRQETKRALVGDLHIGCHSNSEHWHKTSLKFAEFLRDSLIEQNISEIEFFGDFFDNRNEIGVQTLHVAAQFLDILNEFSIIIIAGNHDMFFKNRNDVHSISILSGRNNVRVIDNAEYETIADTRVLHLPWGASIDTLESTDMIFGHLELNGFYMMAGKPAEGKTDPSQLLKKCDTIFSGHFHLRDEREFNNGKKIIYIGTPYQLNWGEISNIPGFYIIDFNTKHYSFIENTTSPRHIKISSTDINMCSTISGNIVSVEFTNETPEEQMKLRNEFFQHTPAEIKFTIKEKQTLQPSEEITYDTNINLLSMMWDFADKLDIGELAACVKDKLKEIYNKYAK